MYRPKSYIEPWTSNLKDPKDRKYCLDLTKGFVSLTYLTGTSVTFILDRILSSESV